MIAAPRELFEPAASHTDGRKFRRDVQGVDRYQDDDDERNDHTSVSAAPAARGARLCETVSDERHRSRGADQRLRRGVWNDSARPVD